jgi:uncharacterized protein (DUF2141 family)
MSIARLNWDGLEPALEFRLRQKMFVMMTKSLLDSRAVIGGLVLAAGAGALALSAAPAPATAQQQYANLIPNDMSNCAPGKGPAVRVTVTGVKSGSGNLILRHYHARSSDWMKSKRYIAKLHSPARKGNVSFCVPVPQAGNYAMTVQHNVDGSFKTSLSNDGAGMSNNPDVKTFVGIPRPPGVDKTTFKAGEGVTRISIQMRYMD